MRLFRKKGLLLGGGCEAEEVDWCGRQTTAWHGTPGPSQTPTHLLVVADLILRAVGPWGARGDGLSPRQGHTLGFHSVPANLILLPGS